MDRFQDRRLWLAGGALAAVLVLAVAWLMFIGPELSSSDSLRSQAATTRQQNAILSARVAGLRARSTHVHTYSAALARTLEALPPDSGLPAFTREVSTHAAATGVHVQSVVVGGIVPRRRPVGGAAPTAPSSCGTRRSGTAATTRHGCGGRNSAGRPLAISVTLQWTGALAQQLRLPGPAHCRPAQRAHHLHAFGPAPVRGVVGSTTAAAVRRDVGVLRPAVTGPAGAAAEAAQRQDRELTDHHDSASRTRRRAGARPPRLGEPRPRRRDGGFILLEVDSWPSR